VLLCSYPEASKAQESLMGRVPLHFAAWKGTSTAVVDTLMKVAPEAASVSNFFGSTPLEIVEKNSSPAKESIRASLTGELPTECKRNILDDDVLLSNSDVTEVMLPRKMKMGIEVLLLMKHQKGCRNTFR